MNLIKYVNIKICAVVSSELYSNSTYDSEDTTLHTNVALDDGLIKKK